MLLPFTDLPGARAVCEDVHEQLKQASAAHDWGTAFSMGVAVFAQAPATAAEALRAADALMYGTKRATRNGLRITCVDEPAMPLA
ncbi:MAG: hypothetical protein Q4G71_12905 [Pseudomonadota bacterium]|nr:hypothetical protein [Pseudomonadota bacterium]